VKVVVTLVPLREQFEGTCSRAALDTVQSVAEGAGVTYFDSFNALKAQFGTTPAAQFYIPGDMHLNERGNAAWARTYLDLLTNPEHGLLPPQWQRLVQ